MYSQQLVNWNSKTQTDNAIHNVCSHMPSVISNHFKTNVHDLQSTGQMMSSVQVYAIMLQATHVVEVLVGSVMLVVQT